MAKDRQTRSDDVRYEPGSVLRNVALMALPLFSLQRSVLDVMKAGIEKAVLLRPVQNRPFRRDFADPRAGIGNSCQHWGYKVTGSAQCRSLG